MVQLDFMSSLSRNAGVHVEKVRLPPSPSFLAASLTGDNLDKMASQLQAAGIMIEVDPKSYSNGRFASLHDPDGNPIQLWQSTYQTPKGGCLRNPCANRNGIINPKYM